MFLIAMMLLADLPKSKMSLYTDFTEDIMKVDNTTLYTPLNVNYTVVLNYRLGLHSQGFFTAGILLVRWKSNVIWSSSKILNQRIKASNGNRSSSTQLKLIHWNTSSKLWHNKLIDIEALLCEKNPEANLWIDTLDADRIIPGYQLVLPNTMEFLQHVRIVLFVKSDLKFHLMREHMEKDTAAKNSGIPQSFFFLND